MKIDLHGTSPYSLDIVPGQRFREWLSPHAYRCLPLAAANELGWDVLMPGTVEATWNGGKKKEDLTIVAGEEVAESHFGLGTFTLKIAHTWKTEPGVQLLVMPVPNMEWRGVLPLTAVIETDRLNYPWFVSMRMTQPGEVRLEKGTPICRVIPIRIADVLNATIGHKPEPEEVRNDRLELTRIREETGKAWTKIYHNRAKYRSIRTPQVGSRNLLAENGILAVQNFFSAEECTLALALREATDPSISRDPYWRGRFRVPDWPSEMRERLQTDVPARAGAFYAKSFVAEEFNMTDWDAGKELPPHTDYGQHGQFPDRHYASVIYLNDGYEGGEIYFPELGLELIPEPGLLLVFPGGTLLHGVRKIKSGRRVTAISWLAETG